jgi:undecaprenyl-diphosphatase
VEGFLKLDRDIVIWLNQGIGQVALLDYLGYLLVSDYFIPLLISFWMLGVWFWGKDVPTRDRNQRAVLHAAISLGFANLAVLILNQHFFRERPLSHYELTNLLYQPTDSSFPANPAALTFAAAMGLCLGNRRAGPRSWSGAGLVVFALAGLWSLVRVANGLYYPSDVLAGGLIGVAVSGLVALALRLIEPVPTLVLRGARLLHLA